MLTDTDGDLVRRCMNALRDGIAGVQDEASPTRRWSPLSRNSGLLPASRMKVVAAGATIAVIEAGTGTGKSSVPWFLRW